MRWSFLVVITLVGILVNIAFVTEAAFSNIPAIVAFNMALAGLALIWYGSYFEQNVVNAKCKDLGISLLFFAAGVSIVLGGLKAVLADSCDGFMSSGRRYRLRDDIARFVQSLGYCRELGYIVVFAGAGFAYAGARLVFRITRRGY